MTLRLLPFLLCLFTVAGLPARATVLVFENTSGFNLGVLFPGNYGDRVTAVSQDGFRYLMTGGPTPNIEASYVNVAGWPSGYGNLTNIIYVRSPGPLELTLTADPGFEVLLHGFDLGAWLNTNRVIRSVQVLDLGGAVLFGQDNVQVNGLQGTHSSLSFAAPLQARVLRIRIDSGNLGTSLENIGIDNVHYSQTTVPVFTDVALYPGVKVYGTLGRTYRIDYVDAVNVTTWTPLTTLQLTNNPSTHVDVYPPGTPRRFYRAVELP